MVSRLMKRARDPPFVVLVEQDRPTRRTMASRWKGAHHFGPPLDLAIEALDGLVLCNLARYWSGKRMCGEDVGLGVIHKGGDFGQLGTQLVGDPRADET